MNAGEQNKDKWNNANVQVFWGEIAACDHSVQIYENDNVFLDTLESFAKAGLLAGDSVILIATEPHLDTMNERLTRNGFDMAALKAADQYMPVSADEALSHFMVNEWPDEALFNAYITQVILRASWKNRKVRAFGEMVAVLWEKGLSGATVQLEKLWCQLHRKDSFTLYCAYPKSGFTQSATESINKICSLHARVIGGKGFPATEIYYR